MEKMSEFNTLQKSENILLNVQNYSKFEYKVMNTFWSYRLHKLGTPKHYGWKKMSKFNTRQKVKKI